MDLWILCHLKVTKYKQTFKYSDIYYIIFTRYEGGIDGYFSNTSHNY